MAYTRICDKCGKHIDNVNKLDSLSIRKIVNYTRLSGIYHNSLLTNSYELCPECTNAFENWINTKPE